MDYSLEKLGFGPGTRTVKFWAEGITPSYALGYHTMTVALDRDGPGPTNPKLPTTACVYVTVGDGILLNLIAATRFSVWEPAPLKRHVDVQRGLAAMHPYSLDIASALGSPPSDTKPISQADYTIGNATHTEQAFWIFDAMITASRFHARLPGAQTGIVHAEYPVPVQGGMAPPINDEIWIKDQRYRNWDLVCHEYGHTVAQEHDFWGGAASPTTTI